MAQGYGAPQNVSLRETAVVGADGTAEVIFGPVDSGCVMAIFQAQVMVEGSDTEGPAYLYVGSVSPQNFKSGTKTGTLDNASWAHGLRVPSNEVVTLVWTGLTPGATCYGSIEGQQLVEAAIPDTNFWLRGG